LRLPYVRFGIAPPSWINPDWARTIGLEERWRNAAFPVTLKNHAQDTRYHAYELPRRHINWDNSLAYLDAHDIEVRHPFHDLRLSGFLMGAAGEFLRRGDLKKYLLRQAIRGTLPEGVRARRDKANFSKIIVTAVERYFRERDPMKLRPVQMGWIDGAYIRSLQEEYAAWWQAGRPSPPPRALYNVVWTVVALDMWLEHAFEA
jgi:asparagine synthase (glutamine-hydrolysing)